MTDLKSLSLRGLLRLHVDIMEELRYRGVVKSANNPTGDLAEFLFCRTFSWQQASNSQRGFDAHDEYGKRYQIKGRRLHRRNTSRQLSAMRDLEAFDTLAAVLFDDDYRVSRAALIPNGVVRGRCSFVQRTNSYRFMLTDEIWDDGRVRDVTAELQGTQLGI